MMRYFIVIITNKKAYVQLKKQKGDTYMKKLKKPNTENRAVLNCYTDESTTGNTLITAGAIVVASVATGAIIVPND